MFHQLQSLLLIALSVTRVAAYPRVEVKQAAARSTPSTDPYVWNKGSTKGYIIHESCNATEKAQLLFAFEETSKLANHAKEHILLHGASSDFYQTYFGDAKTGEPIGWFEKVASGEKSAMLWRCDDVDQRCSDPERAGYNREESHFEEAVVCPYSYETRMPLAQLCAFGYTVSQSPDNTVYFASDIMHRIFHMPGFGENLTLDHYADGFENCTKLATEEPAKAVRNSATLRLFALDVYAYDIAVPGVGCTGDEKEAVSSSTAAATSAATSSPSSTENAPKNCHTHSNGDIHCE